MQKLKIGTLGFFALFFSVTLSIKAQQSGNIVEYFGRDVIEKIEEGVVSHLFTQGLKTSMGIGGMGLLPGRDIVAWQFANGNFRTPAEGTVFFSDGDNSFTWESIQANDENVFQSRDLRRSYLYTAIESPRENIVLLDAKGHTRVHINGKTYEGDHYDFGYTLIPVKLKKGLNEFIYTPGRFGRVASKLVTPAKPVMLTTRDLTLPSLITGESGTKWAAIRVINAQEKDLRGLSVKCILQSGEEAVYETDGVMAMSVRKVKFKIPELSVLPDSSKVKATVILCDSKGKELDRKDISLHIHKAAEHHERTFVSDIDGSVQYYAIAPSTVVDDGQALVLSVHGAGVEARNQARAYKQKEWCHVVAATNRRPYGFNWEEWGRTDALEVLCEAQKVFKTNPAHTYLTGHSMGGHGTWHLGVTFPDRFAAIAPCAGYPDILGYGRPPTDGIFGNNVHYQMYQRGANGGRTLQLKRNFLQSGIYILHGDEDTVVPTNNAREMRKTLSEFHPNFVYYEYPGGSHWYGDHSVDWHAIFNYFKWQTIPETKNVKHLEFHTASPAINADNYWITINQQEKLWDFSSVKFDIKNDTIRGTTSNVNSLTFKLSSLELKDNPLIIIDEQTIRANTKSELTLKKESEQWKISQISAAEKNPQRYGGFKNAFYNRAVLVYATGGSREENEWYQNKARFDAETFLYRANGSFEIVSDKEFLTGNYDGRNIILYGNSTNNKAWNAVLNNCPVTVSKTEIRFGDRHFEGDNLGIYFVYPRSGSETASVGVVAGTGIKGMKATFGNDYISGVNGYPDLLIFNSDFANIGLGAIQLSGFFGSDWSVENGDFAE